MSSTVAGKVVLITGGTGGIGSATARMFAELGATVVVGDVDDEAGKHLAEELGDPHRYVHLDVTDFAEWERAVADVVGVTGKIDVVFLNAGIMIRGRGTALGDDPLEWMTEARTKLLVDVNVFGALYGFLAVLPHMKESGGGHVILQGGFGAIAADPVYSMTKMSMFGLARALAPVAAPHGITVVCLQPTGVDTGIVPSDVRASGLALNPPSRAAGTVVKMVEEGEPGDLWVMSPATDPAPSRRYPDPEVPQGPSPTSARSDSLMKKAIGQVPSK